MSFDVKDWKKSAGAFGRPKRTYIMEYEVSGEKQYVEFSCRPRTPALYEEVVNYIHEDAQIRDDFLSAMERGEPPERVPEPEYKMRWRLFKMITEGPFELIEEDFMRRADMDVVDMAIADFFGM